MENLADISEPPFSQMSKEINKYNFYHQFIQVSVREKQFLALQPDKKMEN